MYGNLSAKKAAARALYKSTRSAYLENQTTENWRAFCEAQCLCARLGVRI